MEGAAHPALSFAGLLRQLRAEARLTQEELAEAAGLSPRSISDLERGINRTARKETALLLAGALGLDGQVRTLFVAAARGRAPACEVLTARDEVPPSPSAVAATRALPRDIGSFTGRQPELAQLLAGEAADGALGGVTASERGAGSGKTPLAVHAAPRLAARFPDGQFFLPLHAHAPGQQPVSPADALASLLLTAGVAVHDIPPGREARASRWRDHVAGKKILLVLDDAAGHEQIRPLLPGSSGSLVLITSRRRLTALEDAGVVSIDTLPPGDAVALLARLAGPGGPAHGGGPGRGDSQNVRIPAAGHRNAREAAAAPPGPRPRRACTRAGGGPRPAGRDARREPVGRRRLRPVLPGPDPCAAAAVPQARAGPGHRHRRLRGRSPR